MPNNKTDCLTGIISSEVLKIVTAIPQGWQRGWQFQGPPAFDNIPTWLISALIRLKRLVGLNLSKASRPDQVPAQVLKECAKPALTPVIADFYQQSIDEARLPQWLETAVCPPNLQEGI